MKTKERVKQAIVDYIQEYGYPPSIREIADMAYCAQSTAHQYVQELLRAGELETSHPGKSRALRLPERRYWIDRRVLMETIAGLSGCDGEDDYARGWDDACEAVLRAMDEMVRENDCCPDWKTETGEERSCKTCGGQCLSPGAYCVHTGYSYWTPIKPGKGVV